jgi:hypothetical protein
MTMTVLFSLVGLLVFVGLGAFTLYLLIDLLEYVKRFHAAKWREISYARPFGMRQEDFYFYPVRPMRFIPFLLSPESIGDSHLAGHKNKIKLALGAMLLMLVIFFASSLIG